MKSLRTQPHRIAIYIRVSTEEQAANPEGSMKSQEQRLRANVAMRNAEAPFGEVVRVFIDRAKSGKDTNRPDLQRLLKAITERDVSLVMVTELSRLSRSIKDFAEMWEMMRGHGCEFQSLREQFDTTTAAGEMVIYTIANIAQFERRQVSERVSANFLARAQRGLYNGGAVPVGYKRNTEKRGYLEAEEETAPLVREAFAAFLKEGTLSAAGKALNASGHRLPRRKDGGGDRMRMGHFTQDNLHGILTNRIYLGIRIYHVNGEAREAQAVWPALIEKETFDQVQALLKKNYRRNKTTLNNRYPFLLSGLVFCGACDDRLPGKSAWGNGGKVPYYEHGWATKRQSMLNKKVFACHPHRVQAKILEPKVWEKVQDVLFESERADRRHRKSISRKAMSPTRISLGTGSEASRNKSKPSPSI